MIFVTVGSQKFPFNRLLQQLDLLVERGEVKDQIFAQTGYSTYEPVHYPFEAFLDQTAFTNAIEKSAVVLSHGGTGSIINSVKQGKKVIAVPRKAVHGEHVDDHQAEIIEHFTKLNIIYGIDRIEELSEAFSRIHTMEFQQYESNTDEIIGIISQFIRSS